MKRIVRWSLVVVPVLMLAAPAVVSAQGKLKDITVEESASPELVGQLSKGLSISPAQAEGAAGAMLGAAKGKLSAADFGEVSKSVPGIEGLLKAAPAAMGGGKMGALMGLAGGFKQLGIDPGLVTKAVPLLTQFVSGKGGAGAASLLAGALK